MSIRVLPYDGPPHPRRRLDLLHPPAAHAPYALCFVHGGGWRAGEAAQWHRQMRRAGARGVVSASLGYRVGERLPALLDDVADGYRRFLSHLDRRGLGGLPVFLVGSSAGAHLATLLALSANGLEPAGCVSVNGPGASLRPWPGMDPEIRAAVEHLAGGDYAAASPGHHADPATAPPTLFIVVGKERYFPHEHVRELAGMLPRSRVVLLPDAEHGFLYDPAGRDSARAQAEIEVFIAQALRG
ncbi:alpha/beta hydrolase [Nonomuraea sp. NPDC050790]|uniref:alpha/beta hydrolase n=1 Tax=Nonomuraea sp. NPDC050790 TaxID=3364371 RepID=UPI0037B83935